jgi:hypothetical protein
MSRIRLIAASDDYLLEERLALDVAEVCAELGGVDPEIQGDDATPESVATELVSPSLFASERVLVVPDVRVWLGAAAPAGVAAPSGSDPDPDPEPLVRVLTDGAPDGMALVMGAWCGRKPTGPLVDAVQEVGSFEWIRLPAPPKPWEKATLSDDQIRVLEGVLRRAADGVAFDGRATRMLLERLGFAPRLLVQEVRKLCGAAGDGGVDEDLVRTLVFPRERSLEVVRDAVLQRELEPLLDLLAAASAGLPVNDWRGERLDPKGVGPILVAQVANLLHQMLYLRRLAAAGGLTAEMSPERTAGKGWYAAHFKSELAGDLAARLKDDAPSPLIPPGGKPPTPFTLGALFAGAGRYTDGELIAAISKITDVENGIRQEPLPLEVVTVWLSGLIGRRAR